MLISVREEKGYHLHLDVEIMPDTVLPFRSFNVDLYNAITCHEFSLLDI